MDRNKGTIPPFQNLKCGCANSTHLFGARFTEIHGASQVMGRIASKSKKTGNISHLIGWELVAGYIPLKCIHTYIHLLNVYIHTSSVDLDFLKTNYCQSVNQDQIYLGSISCEQPFQLKTKPGY